MDRAPLESQAAVASWLRRRSDQWARLQKMAGSLREQGSQNLKEVGAFVQGFRSLARDVSLARTVMPDSRLTRQLETVFMEMHEAINRVPLNLWEQLISWICDDVPRVTKALRYSILATTGLFLLCGVVGWLLVSTYPELAGLFAAEEMINQVQKGKLWTEGLINVIPSSLLSLSIMTNNIVVAFFAFCLGAFFGLGTLYIIGLNGLMLGGIFAFTGKYGLADELFSFVFAHGVVELSIICLAGAAGIQLGEALVRPGDRARTEAFREAVFLGATLVPVCVVFLVGAGLIEGYISPDPAFPLSFRIGVGLSYGVLLWAVLTGKIWVWRKGHSLESSDPSESS